MKKSLLLSLVLLSWILLTACGNKSDDEKAVDIDKNLQSENLVNDQESENVAVNDCEKSIQKYLNGADKEWKWDGIKAGDNIVVDYIWRLDDGTVFDTSIQSIAEACGTYSEGRDYTEWLSFQAWAGQMIKWFDDGVLWMKVWQTKTVKFWAEDGYGEYDESLVMSVSISEVGDVTQLKEWDIVYLGMGYPAKVLKITDKEVTFDMNHELAWKDLIFDITVKSIN